MRFIEVFKEDTPYIMQIPLNNGTDDGDGTTLYDVEVNYNHSHDFFALSIGIDGESLLSGERLVLNRPIASNYDNAPSVDIVPRNRPNQKGDVIYENMGDTVLLAVEDR